MKKNFVYCRTFAGCDWHDIIETVKIISTEDDLSVSNVPEAIAGDIMQCFQKDRISVDELIEGIRELIAGKKRVHRVLEFKLKKERHGQDVCLALDMSNEITFAKEYFYREIEETDIVYLPLRFIQAGTKPVDYIEELLTMPTATPQEAAIAVRREEEKGRKQTFWNYVNAKDEFGVFAADGSRLQKSRWYAEETFRLEASAEELMKRYLGEYLADGKEKAPSFLQYVFRCHSTAYEQVEASWKAFLEDEGGRLEMASREAYGPDKAAAASDWRR